MWKLSILFICFVCFGRSFSLNATQAGQANSTRHEKQLADLITAGIQIAGAVTQQVAIANQIANGFTTDSKKISKYSNICSHEHA